MRNIIISAALALSLGGCVTAGGVPDPRVTDAITRVQSTTQAICSFLPTATTVANIIATFSGSSVPATITGIATAICNAVNRPAVRRGASRPTVRGVVIYGRFVR